jgi:hypothetical protein
MLPRFFLLIAVSLWLASPCTAEFYRYKDENGVIRFTDNLADVPEDQRPEAKGYTEPDDNLTPEEKAEKKQATVEAEQKKAVETEKKKETEAESVERESLTQRKTALEQEYADLMKERETVMAGKEKLETPEEKKAYYENIDRFNNKLSDFEKRHTQLQKDVEVFNKKQKETPAQ